MLFNSKCKKVKKLKIECIHWDILVVISTAIVSDGNK